MAGLRGLNSMIKKCFMRSSALQISARSYAGYWNKDWKPAQYPTTPEERERAAKKYGLIPEDYEPYPDDGCGSGDYPMLPRISSAARDPFEDYDIPSLKRNYGEPLHMDADWMREDAWDPNMDNPISYTAMFMIFFGIVGGTAFLVYLAEPYQRYMPMFAKQFPKDLKSGQKHYTFEKEQ